MWKEQVLQKWQTAAMEDVIIATIHTSLTQCQPVAMYAERKFIDGRSHSSPWKSLFSDDTSTVSQDEFIVGLQKLPYRLSMGPPSLPEEIDSADLPSEAMLRKLWKKIARSDEADLRISQDQLFTSLKTLTGEEHGAMWGSFHKIFHDSSDS
eukprot:gene31876-41362_t